jgi:hypothetical protein
MVILRETELPKLDPGARHQDFETGSSLPSQHEADNKNSFSSLLLRLDAVWHRR